MLAPSKAVCRQQVTEPQPTPVFSEKQVALYQTRYEEGYNIDDPEYVEWLKQTHPEAATKSDGDSLKTHVSSSDDCSAVRSSLSDILILPEPQTTHRKRKPGINSRAVCLSALETLQELKDPRSPAELMARFMKEHSDIVHVNK